MPDASPSRFDLDAAVAAWRRQLATRRALDADDVDELEAHLLDEIDDLRAAGASAERAYHEALARIGAPETLDAAYREVYWTRLAAEGGVLRELTLKLTMLRTHLKIALRHLRRRPLFGGINVFGLAVGLGACLLIGLYARYEFSFDRYHENGDRLYRLVNYSGFAEKQWGGYILGDPIQMMRDEMPAVEQAVKVQRCGQGQVRVGDERYDEIGIQCTDGALFELFSYDLVRGDAATALASPNTAVVTRSLAERLFGHVDPVGRTIVVPFYGDDLGVEITGLMEDVPRNSHQDFDLLMSHATLEATRVCTSCGQPMYALLAPGADTAAVAAQVFDHIRNVDGKETTAAVGLERVSAIHFSDIPGARQGDRRYLYVLSAIALAVLFIACANYMNLATARYAQRMREVGVRKALGARRGEVARQFLLEAFLVTLLALPLALVLVAAALPGFNTLAGTDVRIGAADLGVFVAAGLVLVALVGTATGSYPAFFLSGFRPAEVLRGRPASGFTAAAVRRGLVVFQFGASAALIALTLVIVQQLDYMQTKKLGFDGEQLVAVQITDGAVSESPGAALEAFRTVPGVVAVSAGSGVPGQPRFGGMQFGHRPEDAAEGEEVSFIMPTIDEHFLETMQVPLAAGRNIGPATPEARTAEGLANEAALRMMGWSHEDALGQVIGGVEIVGVVPDFHFQSLHQPIEPLLMAQLRWGGMPTLTVRLAGGDVAGALDGLEAAWRGLGTAEPFSYVFADDALAALYDEERRVAKVFGVFAGLSILIACLGLVGLAAFTAERRTKEIGIRKVLGASVRSIVALLFRDFAVLLAVALAVAVPVVYLGAERWLEGFAYRIDVSPWVLAAAGAAVFVVAFAAVAAQSVRAAARNPVESLRYE